jgi:hypothetical protein
MLSNILKTTALAALLGLGAVATGAAPAAADTVTTHCFGDDCYRVRCDDFGDNCVRISNDTYDYDRLYNSRYARPPSTRLVCDSFGDNCHYVNVPGYYDSFGIWHDSW